MILATIHLLLCFSSENEKKIASEFVLCFASERDYEMVEQIVLRKIFAFYCAMFCI